MQTQMPMMEENMHTMQKGMKMMKGMHDDTAKQPEMMDQRMKMMQMMVQMMQMMMDRQMMGCPMMKNK